MPSETAHPPNAEVRMYSIASIRRDTFRKYQDPDEKAAFAADIKAHGQRVAGVLAEFDGDIWAADCNRRLEALIENGETEIRAYVDPAITNRIQLLAMQVGSQNRSNLQDMEVAERLAALEATDGLTRAAAGAAVGIGPAKASQLAVLPTYAADVRELFIASRVTLQHSIELASLPLPEREDWLRKAAAEKLSARRLKALAFPKRKKKPDAKTRKVAFGPAVITFPSALPAGDLAAALDEARSSLAEKLRAAPKGRISAGQVFG